MLAMASSMGYRLHLIRMILQLLFLPCAIDDSTRRSKSAFSIWKVSPLPFPHRGASLGQSLRSPPMVGQLIRFTVRSSYFLNSQVSMTRAPWHWSVLRLTTSAPCRLSD